MSLGSGAAVELPPLTPKANWTLVPFPAPTDTAKQTKPSPGHTQKAHSPQHCWRWPEDTNHPWPTQGGAPRQLRTSQEPHKAAAPRFTSFPGSAYTKFWDLWVAKRHRVSLMSWHLTHIDFRSELGARRGAGGSPTSRLWAESLPLPQIAAASHPGCVYSRHFSVPRWRGNAGKRVAWEPGCRKRAVLFSTGGGWMENMVTSKLLLLWSFLLSVKSGGEFPRQIHLLDTQICV